MAVVGVIFNPNAGGNEAVPERIKEFARAAGPHGVVLPTHSVEELPAVARRLAAQRIEVLAVCGGDGSFFRALSACIPAFGEGPLPYFLPLPAGSMNTIARSLRWRRRNLVEAVADVAAAPDVRRIGPVIERNVIRVNGDRYGFMVGAGVIVHFLSAYYDEPSRGPLAAARLVARLAWSGLTRGELGRQLFAAVDGEVESDGARLPWQRYNVLYAATVSELGLGFRVTHRAGTVPDTFHLLAGEPQLGKLVWRLPHIKQGWPLEAPQLFDALSAEVTAHFKQPTPYMIDGDILDPVKRLDLQVGPRLSVLL